MLESLYNLMGLVFVLSTMVSMGLGLTVREITDPLRDGRFVGWALVVNFVVVPALAYGLVTLFGLDGPLSTGLILVALAAGAPGLPKMAQIAKQETAPATGLMVLLIVATIVIMPIALPLLISGIDVGFWDIASGLILMILLPLALSVLVRERHPGLAASAKPYATQASTFSLIVLMVLMVVLNWSNVAGLIGSGGLLASVILIAAAAAAGYIAGGRRRGWVGALGAGQRNIAAAVVVAAMNFAEEPDVLVMIIVFSLLTLLVMVPTAAEVGRHATSDRDAAEIT